VMRSGTKKSRKWLFIAGACALVIGAGAYGLVTLKGASPDIEPSRIATVERGTMVRSVVATGKVEPIAKVEIKSKANGLINVLRVDVDSVVKEGDVLVELDKEQLRAALRGAEANLQAARASVRVFPLCPWWRRLSPAARSVSACRTVWCGCSARAHSSPSCSTTRVG